LDRDETARLAAPPPRFAFAFADFVKEEDDGGTGLMPLLRFAATGRFLAVEDDFFFVAEDDFAMIGYSGIVGQDSSWLDCARLSLWSIPGRTIVVLPV
jgi:hypothetical protein